MTQLTSTGLIRILGQVTLIMVIPIVGGAVAGIILDRLLATAPLFVLSGFVAGNLFAYLALWRYIRANTRGPSASQGPDR